MVTIREATVDDYDAIDTIFRISISGSLAEENIQDIRRLREQQKDITSFVAVKDNTIVGHASVFTDGSRGLGSTAHFSHLAVHPSYRKRGIAGALLDARMEFVHDYRSPCVAISSATTENPYSQQNLASHGFVPVRVTEYIPGQIGIGFLRLFSPAPYAAALVHFGGEVSYAETLARTVLTSLENIQGVSIPLTVERIREPGVISPRLEQWLALSDAEKTGMNESYPVRLYEPCAVAEIERLTEEGCYAKGVFVRPVEKRTNVSLQFRKLAQEKLHRDGFHVIDEAQPLFDLVWKEYVERTR